MNELYAGNNHFAILADENGDDKLNKEIAKTWEIGGGMNLKNIRFSVNWYHSQFQNYTYLGNTGVWRSFNVREWRSADTEIKGIEAEAGYKMDLYRLGKWEVGSYYDFVKNIHITNDLATKAYEGDYMPNLPVSRLGFSLSGKIKKVSLNFSLDHYLKQKYLDVDLGPALPSYSLLNAYLSYNSILNKWDIEYYVTGNNLLNVEARPQSSPLKFLAPLPGINVSVGVKIKI